MSADEFSPVPRPRYFQPLGSLEKSQVPSRGIQDRRAQEGSG
ncbi:MAG: hypothetical protein AAGU26_05300 [bacterium]|nr:hypothetical protein [Spirochaetales bacterium]